MLELWRESTARQFHSSLKMLGSAIDLCPDGLWLEGAPNRFWHIAYHALFYVHFYAGPSDAAFVPWAHDRPEYNYLGEIPWKPGYKPQIDEPYSKAELKEYLEFCHGEVDRQVAVVDPEAPSGFPWLPFTKLELQSYSLRHLAHHTGQLSERLRTRAGVGLPWAR